jgi:hypothetical protein
LTEQLVQLSVAQQWGLFELIPDNSSLEEIFVELTTADNTDTEQSEEAA